MTVKNRKIKAYAVFIAAALLTGGISALVTLPGMKEYMSEAIKPALSPPGAVFGAVWTLLYTLMGISAAEVYLSDAPDRWRALTVFAVQLAVNFLWSVFFFGLAVYGFALIWLLLLLVLTAIMTAMFYGIKRRAGLLQLPYIAWLCFALYLNFAVWMLNG
ncbi:MAG: tryptophan-rich sensory protein [Oscillospiraceae bacterium]|nr:tryptophan-rich sensory protein [Oscillospiraceae bacterium]